MIRVEYDPRVPALTVRGHAGFCPGTDPVCAGVSALVYTLAENLGERGQTVLLPGRAWVTAPGCPGAAAVFDVVCRGLALMARHYPQCVSYRRRAEK